MWNPPAFLSNHTKWILSLKKASLPLYWLTGPLLLILSLLSSTCSATKQNSDSSMLNVRDFGAYGDGQHDDSAAIQAALNRAAESTANITVYLPQGVYLVSRTSIAGKAWCLYAENNTTIKGDGPAYSTLKLSDGNGGYTRMLYVQKTDNVNIQGLTFDGNCERQRVAEEHMGGIWLNSATNVVIDDCHFVNTCGDGIGIRGPRASSTNIKVRNCDFKNNGRNGITLGSGFSGVLIEQCHFSPDIFASPIDSEPEKGLCKDVIIRNNTFDGDQLEVVTLGGHLEVDGYQINGNTFNNTGLLMIRAKNVVVENNKFFFLDPTKRATIRIQGKNEGIRINNNSFVHHSDRPLFDIAATQSGGTPIDIEVSSNTIETNEEQVVAISVRGAGSLVVAGNTFTHVGNSRSTAILCKSTFAMPTIAITANTFNNYPTGISFIPIKNRTIDQLTIKDNNFQWEDGLNARARSTTQQAEPRAIDLRFRQGTQMIKQLDIDNNELGRQSGRLLHYRQ